MTGLALYRKTLPNSREHECKEDLDAGTAERERSRVSAHPSSPQRGTGAAHRDHPPGHHAADVARRFPAASQAKADKERQDLGRALAAAMQFPPRPGRRANIDTQRSAAVPYHSRC